MKDLAKVLEAGIISPASLFDMTRSGAVLAWQYCFPDDVVPVLLAYIEDRDLWQFRFSATRAINAVVFSHPYDFEVWDKLARDVEHPLTFDKLIVEGDAIERKHLKDVEELVGYTKRWMIIGRMYVPVVNVPYTMASDACYHLLTTSNAPFAASYVDTSTCREFSLRSLKGGISVADIAVSYGGGGHANASGFKMALGWEGDA